MMWWLFDLLGDEDDEWELPTAKGGQHGLWQLRPELSREG
jgi:hypothetical protein